MNTFYLTVQARKAFADDANEQIVYARPFANKADADRECDELKESDPDAVNEVWVITEESDLYDLYIDELR